MKIKFSLRRGDVIRDLTLTADATATAGDVARTLYTADPAGTKDHPGPLTLSVHEPLTGASRILNESTTLADSSLLSGATVDLTRPPQQFDDATRGTPTVLMRVVAGPDLGKEFPLPTGSFVAGREHSADVRLNDPMVSKRHVRINVGETVELIDLGSANGVIISGDLIERAVVSPNDTIVLGDTQLVVVRLQQAAGATATATPQVEHVRSPNVIESFGGTKHQLPSPPKPAQPQRFPLLALTSPLIMGGIMWWLSGEILGVAMMALTPLLLIFGWVDQTITSKRQLKTARAQFDETMLKTQERLEQSRNEERRARVQELPSVAMLREHVQRLGPLLWSERPESSGFLTLSVGTGRLASRNECELPAAEDAIPECWEQVLGLKEEFSTVDGVPIPVELRSAGSIGFAGPQGSRHGVVRAAVFQLVARHSPAEMVVAAIVSPGTRDEWEWLKWLPHTSATQSPIEGSLLADGRGTGTALLSQLEELIATRLDHRGATLRGPLTEDQRQKLPDPITPSVLLVVEDTAPVDRGRLTRLLEQGPDAGVHIVWSAPRVEQIPAACRSYVMLDVGGQDGIAGQVRLGERTAPITLETLDHATALALARILAPVVDVGAPEDDDSDLPGNIAYPDVAGHDLLNSQDSVIERWHQNHSVTPRDGSQPVKKRRESTLRAIVGHAGSEPFVLDLRRDGPHALVGGTTGSGKSEFLQSWVIGMAAAHSPDRLTFLLVDYKGGSAFADCVDLPHTVGLVTDLTPHLVRRALTSLKAELKYREHLFNQKQVKDIVTFEKTGDPDCPPSLVIVIDEFAALATEVPEFVDGVVDVAQRGRSLGLHLIMATQRPQGVIRDNLRANTNLRIALRMADADDSMDILGDRMAAYFDPALPGRGAAKTGPGRIKVFQTGYAGGHTTGEPPTPRIDIEELDFGANSVWETPASDPAETPHQGDTDIARITHTIRAASHSLAIPAPRKPWLNELAPIYSFNRLPNPRTDDKLLLGVMDDPQSQMQPIVCFEPDQDGNLSIIGAGGSGKSTALRTIAVAAGTTTRNGGPTFVYGLDFSSRGLNMLEHLPHVGAIVPGDDEERVIRTIRLLRDIVDERVQRYAAVRAGNIAEYRSIADAPNEPRILLLVDGIGSFKEQYEFGSAQLSQWFNAFAQIAADGRGVGVHLVMAGDRPNAIPPSIASTVQRRIVLRMVSEEDYLLLGVERDVLTPASPPGRGLLDGKEIQIAVLGDSSNVAVQAREIEVLGKGIQRVLGATPKPIYALPDRVELSDLPAGEPGYPTIGVEDASLGPATLPVKGTLLLAGPPSSGRTTALNTIAAAVSRTDPEMRTVLISPRRSILAHGHRWDRLAESVAEVGQLAEQLIEEIEGPAGVKYAIFIEFLTEFTGTEAEFALDKLVRVAAREDHFVVGESETSTWSQAYTLGQPFKAGRRGLLLMPGELDGETLLGTGLGRIRRSDFPPGRGFIVHNGRVNKVHVAQYLRNV